MRPTSVRVIAPTGAARVPTQRRRRSRARAVFLSVVVATTTLGGCVPGLQSGPRVELVNGCGADIAVVLWGAPTTSPDFSTTEDIDRIREGSSRVAVVSDDDDPGGVIADLWVAAIGAPSWGEPTEFSVDDLAQVTLPNGKTARRLTIEGDLCP